jgi:flagellin-like protein
MNRKGITPVIASSLLILIAVSAVATAAVFFRNTTDDITSSANDELSDQKRIEGTSISVERGYNSSNGNISLKVRNTGRYVVLIEENDQKYWSLFADGRPNTFSYASYSSPSRVSLNTGEIITLQTDVDYPSSGSFTRLEIQGRFGIESGTVCSNDGDSQNC